MRVLAIDTALGACQAAVLDGDAVLATRSEAMVRGHQERLAPLVSEAMAGAGIAFADLDRIAVTIGPGSFTGVRVGLALAKGLGVALDVPVLGIGTLPALAWEAEPAGVSVALIDAGRGRLHLQVFDGGAPLTNALTLPMEEVAERIAALGVARLVGPGAQLLLGGVRAGAIDAPGPVAVARLAAISTPEAAPPRPLYLRAPDARTLAERRADAAAAAAA